MKGLFAAAFAAGLVAVPAQAAVPAPVMKVMGADFLARCSNPPAEQGREVVAICAAYVAGIADDLKDAGRACIGPRATAEGLLPYSLDWLKRHSQNGGLPAVAQIRTGLMVEFPCHRPANSPRQAPAPDPVKFGKKLAEYWSAIKPLLALVLH